MKKFMIYFLMAFLFIGACQARSEIVTGNVANAKALTYAYSPTISKCLTPSPAIDTWEEVTLNIEVVDVGRVTGDQLNLPKGNRVQLELDLYDEGSLVDPSLTQWEVSLDQGSSWAVLDGTASISDVDYTGKDIVLTVPVVDAAIVMYRATVYSTGKADSTSTTLTINYVDEIDYNGLTVAAHAGLSGNHAKPVVAVCGGGKFALQMNTKNDLYNDKDTLLFSFYDESDSLIYQNKRLPNAIHTDDNRGASYDINASDYVANTPAIIRFYGTVQTLKGGESESFNPVMYTNWVEVAFFPIPEVNAYVEGDVDAVCVGEPLLIKAKLATADQIGALPMSMGANYYTWKVYGVPGNTTLSENTIGIDTSSAVLFDGAAPDVDTVRATVRVEQYFVKGGQEIKLDPSLGCAATDTIDVVVYDNPTIEVDQNVDSLCPTAEFKMMAKTKTVDSRLNGVKLKYTWYASDENYQAKTQIQQLTAAKGDTLTIASMDSLPGTYYYIVEAEYDSTDIPACKSDTGKFVVVVVTPPTFDFVNTDTLCEGGVANVAAAASIQKAGVMNYMWNSLKADSSVVDTLYNDIKGFAVNNDTITTNVLTADTLLKVTAQLFSADNKPFAGCRVDSTILVKVYPDPEIIALTEDFTMCIGGDSVLTVSAKNNAPLISELSYRWLAADKTELGTDTALAINAKELGVGDHKFYIEVSNDHVSCIATDSMTVSILPLPVINLVEADSLCYGGTVVIPAPTFNVDSCADMAFNYFWSINDTTNAAHTIWGVKDTTELDCSATLKPYKAINDLTVTNNDLDSSKVNVASYYFNLVSEMPGCIVRDTVDITFYPDPVITDLPDTLYVCEGNPMIEVSPKLTSSMNYDRGYDYTYILIDAPQAAEETLPDTLFNNQETADNVPSLNLFETVKAVPGTYTVELVVADTANFGCDTRDTFYVSTIKDPEITLESDSALICVGGAAEFNYTVINNAFGKGTPKMDTLYTSITLITPAADYKYQYHVDTLVADSTAKTLTFDADFIESFGVTAEPNALPYQVVLKVTDMPSTVSANNCDAVSDTIRVWVDADPVVSTMKEAVDTVCQGGFVMVSDAFVFDEYLTKENPFKYFWTALDANDSIAWVSAPAVNMNSTDTIKVDYTNPLTSGYYGVDTVKFSGFETPGDHKFVLTVLSDNSDCLATDTFNVYVTTDELIEIVSNNDTICQHNGDQAEFTATVNFKMLDEQFDYTWSYGEGENAIVLLTDTLPFVNPFVTTLNETTIDTAYADFFDTLSAGEHYLYLTVHELNTNCEAVYVDTLVIRDNPTVKIDTTYLLPCADNTTTLTILEESWNPEFSYTWTSKSNLPGYASETYTHIDANAKPELTTVPFKADEIRTYYITATSILTGCYTEDSIVVKTVENPISELTAEVSSTEICAGSNVYLNGTVRPEEDSTKQTYSWYKCDAVESAPGVFECPEYNAEDLCPEYSTLLDTLDSFEDAYDNGGVYCYHLVANTIGYNCPTVAHTDVITVHPNIQVEVSVDQDTVCEGGSVKLTVNVTNKDAFFKSTSGMEQVFYYTVYENNVPISEEMMSRPGEFEFSYITHPGLHESANNYSAYVYQIRVSGFPFNDDKPGVAYPCYTLSPEVLVTVLPDPVVTVAGPSVLPFGYTDTVLTANVTHGFGEITEVQWYKENVAIEGATDLTLRLPSDLPYGEHNYYVDVKQSGSGCQTLSPVHTVYVMDTVILDVHVDNYDCTQKTSTITVTPVGEASAVTRYHWTFNGEDIAEVNNVLYNAAPGTYNIEALMAGGAVVASSEVILPDYGQLQVAISPASPQNVALNGLSTSVTFTAQVAGGSGSYTYQWYMANGDSGEQPIAGAIASTYSTPANLSAGTYFYFVEVVDSASRCSERSGIVQATVANDIVVSIKGVESVCEGSCVTLTAVVEGDQIGHKYQWKYFGDYIPDATGAQYSFCADSIGVGNHEFYVEITRDGCESVLSPAFLFNVIESPVVLAKGNKVMCPGATTTFVAETYSSLVEQPYKWIWFDEAGDTVATTYENHYDFDQAGKYYVEAIYATSICSAVSDTFEIEEAKDLQEIEIKELNDTRFICDGGQVKFSIEDLNLATAEDSIYFGTPSYQWYVNGRMIAGADKNYYYSSPLTADNDVTDYIYSVEVNYANYSCAVAMDTFTVEVVANPTVIIAGDPIICNGNNIELTANVNDILTNEYDLTYQWRENNVDIEGETSNKLFITKGQNVDPYSFTVVVKRNAGCEVESAPFQVLVNEAPVVNVTASANEVIDGGIVTFTAHLNDYNADNLMYQWMDQDSVEIPGATEATYTTPALKATDTYKYIVRVSQKTSDCVAYGSDSVKVVDAPSIETIEVSDTMICEGAPIVVTAHSTLAVGEDFTYTWYKNGILMAGIVDSTFTDYPTVTDGDQAEYVYSAILAQKAEGNDSQMNYSKVVIVKANPTVVISGDPIICNGNNIQLTANVNDTLTDAAEVQYQWRENNVDIEGETGKVLDITKNDSVDPYTFTVVVNRNNGCEIESAPFQVLVNAAPVVNVTVTDTMICAGGEVTFTANLNDYNADNLMYQWYKDSVEIAGATQSEYKVTLNEVAANEFMVKVSQKTSDCVASGKATVTVVADPVINEITVSDTAICEGAPIVVTAHTTLAVGEDFTYTWYKNGVEMTGIVDSTFTDYITVVDGGQAEVVYSAVMSQKMTGCASAMNYAPVVVVKANPTVVISGDPIICNGYNIQLTANVNDTLTDAAEVQYQWRENNVDIEGETGKVLDITKNDSVDPYTFTVVVNRNNGCEVESAPFQVLVNAAPVVNVTVTDTMICAGGEVTMTANLNDYNADNLMYQWYKDSVEIAGATQSEYTVTLNDVAENEFMVKVSQKTSDCVASGKATVTVVADPTIDSVTFDQTEVCEGGIVTVTAHANLVEGQEAIYTWYRNGKLIEGATGHVIVENLASVDGDSTVYTYLVKVAHVLTGCESKTYRAKETVTVYANPSVYVETVGTPVVCEGGQVSLVANVVGGTAATQYQWFLDNVALEGETNNTLTIDGLTARETSYNYHVEIKQGTTGCNNKSNVVEVTVVKAPIVTIASNHDAVCEGGVATLSATIEGGVAGVNGLGTYNFTWKQNGATVAEGADSYTIAADLATGDYAYQLFIEPVDSAYNCGATSNVAYVEVVADPVVTIKVAENYDADVCEGGKTFLVSEVSGGLGENSYQWYRNGIVLAGETNPTLVTDPELEAGSYAYTLYVTQTGVECAAMSNELYSNVIAIPDVTIEGADNVCVGGSVTLNANVTPADASYTEYQWYMNGTAIYGATTPTYVTSEKLNAGDYTYNVTIKNTVSGCVAQSASVVANVVADPKVVILGAENVCVGGSAVLTAEVIGGIEGAEYEYAWYLNGAQIAGANQATYATPTTLAATNPADHNYYTVEVTPVMAGATNHGCNAISESVIADVISGPVAAITGNGTICEGGSLTLVANVATPGNYYYQWYLNGNKLEGATNATYTTPSTLTAGTQQYSVEVAAGLSNENCTYTATADVEVVADPVVSATASISEMCVGGKTVLTATVSDGMTNTENVTYRWTRNGETIANVTGATFTDELLVAGTYEYVVTVEQTESTIKTGCAAESAPVMVTVANQPDVTIVWDGLLDVCEGGSIELTAQIEGGVGTYEYQWRRNNRILPETSEVLTTDNSLTYGEYIYTVTAVPSIASCKQTSSQVTTHVVNQPYWTSTIVRYPEMCEGEIIELAATVEGGVQDNNGSNGGFIIWKSFSDGVENNVAGELGGFSYDIAKVGTYYYYPTYNGPIGSNCVLSAPEGTKVEVHANPTATAVTAEGSDVICADETAEIIVSFTGTAPFTFFVQNMNTNATTAYTTYDNPYSIIVTPDPKNTTTTYHIYSLSDAYCDATPNAADAYVTVIVSDIEFEDNFVKVCPDDASNATFHVSVNSGEPTSFSTQGLSDYGMSDYTNQPFNGSEINIDFSNAEPGDYNFNILIDDCVYPVTVRVLMGTNGAGSIVEQRWDDVVVANNNPETNGGYRFVSYQWYKNGEAIPGATGQYYNEVGGLNGYYSLWAMDENGVVYESCEIAFATEARIKVYPTPAHLDQEVIIELPLSKEELEGGVLDIYDDKGALVQHIDVIEQITKISGFHAAGTYFGRVITGTDEIKTVKFIIVK